jgi:hypothetical protein
MPCVDWLFSGLPRLVLARQVPRRSLKREVGRGDTQKYEKLESFNEQLPVCTWQREHGGGRLVSFAPRRAAECRRFRRPETSAQARDHVTYPFNQTI